MGQVGQERNYVVVGLTGSIGSGKSTVAEVWAAAGAEIVDADEISREIVLPGGPVLAAIVARFGPEVLSANGTLNRAVLRKLVFADPMKRRDLEKITHPEIRARAEAKIKVAIADCQKAAVGEKKIIVYVIPLLFESPVRPKLIDRTVVVSASEEVLIQRIVARDQCSEADARQRLKTQLPSAEKEKLADYVVKNDGDLASLHRAALELLQILKGASPEKS